MKLAPLLVVGLLVGCGPGLKGESPLVASPAASPISVSSGRSVASAVTSAPLALSPRQVRLLQGARSTIGDRYDAGYYAGGPPPPGLGACTDVVYAALKAAGLNLQDEMEKDIAGRRDGYPSLRDANIDYRWAPNQIVWFSRRTKKRPNDADFQPGDVVFWSLLNDGVADHCGIVSDQQGSRGPLMIHNFPPACREDDALFSWPIVGHFRLP